MLAGVLADAQVDLNPYQIEAAPFLFAWRKQSAPGISIRFRPFTLGAFGRLGDLDDTSHANQERHSASRAVKPARTRASARSPVRQARGCPGRDQRAKLALVFPGERGTPFSGWSKAKSGSFGGLVRLALLSSAQLERARDLVADRIVLQPEHAKSGPLAGHRRPHQGLDQAGRQARASQERSSLGGLRCHRERHEEVGLDAVRLEIGFLERSLATLA